MTQGIQSDLGRGIATVVAGGVGSVIGGGKFENGAVTAAYGYLFNHCMSTDCWKELGKGKGQGIGSYFKGVGYDLPKHALAVNGALGPEVQLKALEGERAVVDALKSISDNSTQALKLACVACMNLSPEQESNLQGRAGARMATAGTVSFFSGPVGAAASVGAITGNLLGAGVNMKDQAAVIRAIIFGDYK